MLVFQNIFCSDISLPKESSETLSIDYKPSKICMPSLLGGSSDGFGKFVKWVQTSVVLVDGKLKVQLLVGIRLRVYLKDEPQTVSQPEDTDGELVLVLLAHNVAVEAEQVGNLVIESSPVLVAGLVNILDAIIKCLYVLNNGVSG